MILTPEIVSSQLVEQSNSLVKLSILIPVTPDRFMMLNNLYNELRRQIEVNGYLGKGLQKWNVDVPRLDENGQQMFTENGSPIFDVKSHSFKHPDLVEIILDKSNKSIGEKRNNLLNKAVGEYVCFIDSDDWVSKDYVKLIMDAIQIKPDCVSLKGVYIVDGEIDGLFDHSITYPRWETRKGDTIKYLRNTNHLNTIRRDIAVQFKFPEKNFGEDHDYSKQLQKSGLLKNEVYISEVLYEYRYNSKKAVA